MAGLRRFRGGWTILALLAPRALPGQANNPHDAQPERPTVATHAGTVSPGWIELEAGVEYDRLPGGGGHALAEPTLLKLGLLPRLQLSLGLPLVAPPGGSLGPGDWSAGLKVRVLERAGPLGDVAVLPTLKLPSGRASSGRGTGTTDLSLLLISSSRLGPIAVDLNAGVTRRSGDGTRAPRSAAVWAASFGGPATAGLGWVAECFGFPKTSGPTGSAGTVALLGGPTYQVRPWLILDAGGVLPLRGPQPRAVYLGLTWNAGRL